MSKGYELSNNRNNRMIILTPKKTATMYWKHKIVTTTAKKR